MQTVNSKVNLSPASDIIDALQNILRSHGIIEPDLETTYSRSSLPNMNHPAIEDNGESISAIVTERQQQLYAVLRDISGLETVMDGIKNFHQQLVEQKERITQSMSFHTGLVSALWRLPTEVLSQIFHHCLPGDKYLSPASNLVPMRLTRICRPWREVAVDMPSLWCRLYVTTDIGRFWDEEDLYDYSDSEESDAEVDNREWQPAAFFYNSWLKRSQGLPLSLVVERYDSAKLLRSLLQPYINQISFLSIHFSTEGRTRLLLKDVPALQELVILGMENSDISSVAQSISQLPSTMRILDTMHSMFHIRDIYSFNPVWAHLTHVKISLHDLNVFLHLLRLCPNLSSLTALTFSYEEQTLEPLTHTNIRSLHLIDHHVLINRLPRLFNALTLPNLRVLHIHYAHTLVVTCPHPSEELKAFLARSNCPLESLIYSDDIEGIIDVPRAEYVALIPSLDVV